mgnify:CR=1 FL=1
MSRRVLVSGNINVLDISRFQQCCKCGGKNFFNVKCDTGGKKIYVQFPNGTDTESQELPRIKGLTCMGKYIDITLCIVCGAVQGLDIESIREFIRNSYH